MNGETLAELEARARFVSRRRDGKGRTFEVWIVTIEEGAPRPTNAELVRLAAGGRAPFGGSVESAAGNTFRVRVNTD